MEKNIEPKRVFYYFEELSRIPRCSYDEENISNYIKEVGEKLGLEVIQDDKLNVIIRKPASQGYENSEGVIIQGHMDMVCEKEDDSNHDFSKDSIKLLVDGDYVHADKTTLGGDNGIALAMGLAILEDKNLEHPSIELLVTTSEETEMDGALGLSDKVLKGKRLLNIDSEDEGVLVAGSAGGELIEISIPMEFEEIEENVGFEIVVRGLKGGHSGMEIHKPRGNSIKLLNNIIKSIKNDLEIDLVEIDAGTKDNAIPRFARARISIKSASVGKFETLVNTIREDIISKYKQEEPELEIIVKESAANTRVLKKEIFTTITSLIDSIPTGVFTWLPDNKNIVESSSNLAIIRIDENKIKIQVSIRSSKEDVLLKLRENILNEIKDKYLEYNISGKYPEWEYKSESNLRNTAVDLYKEMFNTDMEVTVIHAGLECGVFAKKYDLDIISFGPNMYDVHTPKEKLSISSTKRVYEYLIKLLEQLK